MNFNYYCEVCYVYYKNHRIGKSNTIHPLEAEKGSLSIVINQRLKDYIPKAGDTIRLSAEVYNKECTKITGYYNIEAIVERVVCVNNQIINRYIQLIIKNIKTNEELV